ncbi:hypothetical protein [Actinacidiphila oryziradicis]|uniref:Uncharacterized protein n=1 Tax=Actinacidiphila oryziradicis TaxID=2571141 RepID=A0A4U0SPV7_9ACTN|nr:hypothetical protein [Actinacidiphila oryziradicis]TKA11946.1 hypothetical protein FCI23_09005 [Actinacidiphila oryziradicis]
MLGNDPEEPCHKDAFADSSCAQAWQWVLDKVVDVHGNAMVVNWQQETNYYAPNKKFKSPGDAPRGAIHFQVLETLMESESVLRNAFPFLGDAVRERTVRMLHEFGVDRPGQE